MTRAYYNDNDQYAAEWLRQLISAGLIAPGDVDDRSIVDVRADDLRGYDQCHFFAGIGGWSYALRLAGWSDETPVWSGSCPCQPFSVAGRHKATEDERHLWPEFYRLIRECNPPTVFGEQVSSELGLQWLDGVFIDLEGSGYACAGADLPAASVGAPHIRQRIYWVGYAGSERFKERRELCESRLATQRIDETGEVSGMADNNSERRDGESIRLLAGESRQTSVEIAGSSEIGWSNYDIIPCGDGKSRRIESSVFPLVDGFPERVGLLRGYGNSIVPACAAEFIKAAVETVGEVRM